MSITIKTALLSYGLSGKVFHAPFLTRHHGFKLVGCWERSKKLIQSDYPDLQLRSYNTLEELLEDDIDLIVVNTPVDTHFDYAKKAMLAGKHVLVEKAFTTTTAEAEELLAISQEQKVKLTVYQNRRWDSDFKTVKQVLDENQLGDIVEAEFHFDRFNPGLSIKSHKEVPNPGAGILKDLGPHIIDQALHLFGVPIAVHGDVRITRVNSVVEDWFDAVLYYNDKRVRVKASFFVREPVAAYVVHGTKGSLHKHRGDVQEDVLKTGAKPSRDPQWGMEDAGKEGVLHTEVGGIVEKRLIPTLSGNYFGIFDGVYDAIAHDAVEPVTAADGARVMKVIDVILESSQQRRVIDL